MSIGDALHFEKSWISDIWKGIKRDPKRLFLGVDPISTKGWNAVLGRNDKPVVGHLGGPTKESYQNAQDKGIKTGTASTLHGIAKAVAGAYGAYGASGGLGNAAGSIGGGNGEFADVGSGAYGNSALADAGFGGSSAPALAGTGGTTAGSGSSGFDWQKLVKQGMGGQGQGQDSDGSEDQRQLEQWMEEERMRREAFRRDAIARAMKS